MLTKEDKKWLIELLFGFAYHLLDAHSAKNWRDAALRKIEGL